MFENLQFFFCYIFEVLYFKFFKYFYFFLMQFDLISFFVDEENFNKLIDVYKVCLDEFIIKEFGIVFFVKIVEQVKQLFFVFDSLLGNVFSEIIFFLFRYGVVGFVFFGMGVDDVDLDVVVVFVVLFWRIGFLFKECYDDDVLVKKYQGVVVDVFFQFGFKENKDVFVVVVDFEKKFVVVLLLIEEWQDVIVSVLLFLVYLLC